MWFAWAAWAAAICACGFAWCGIRSARIARNAARRCANLAYGVMMTTQVDPHSGKYNDGTDSGRDEIRPDSSPPLPHKPQDVPGRHRST